MLRFLRKRLPNIRQRHYFLLKTLCLSAGAHGLLALIVLIGMQFSSPYILVVRKERINKNARIVLIPLARRVTPNAVEVMQHTEVKTVAARTDIQQKKSTPSRSAVPEKKSTTTVKKEEAVKPPLNTSEKKVIQEKKVEEKPTQKKETTSQEKTVEKKLKSEKEKSNQKVVQNNQQQNQDVVTTPKKIQKQEVPQKTLSQKIVEPESLQDDELIIYVGREDLQELKFYNSVCYAIEKEWQPPAGLPSTCGCEITFIVGHEGKALNVQVLESSSILAYDIAARSAVFRARFEPYARGKKCTVSFKV